ncbi:CD3324 family protein [Paenibacillus sp. OSY-SE]|uniref:CD3324 family protein n=1 Tax=Paenibacillus sp. OSY-SE TaxID=1196323 RepID=UPI0002F33665|nr:CD3324 family protein [Paenibacillus sp. OSY-SE]
MKYKNANDVLPEELISEIQKHINGEILYIPRPRVARKKWGETSGYRLYLIERNKEIKRKFKAGCSIQQLAIEYSLSYDSIRKIVYVKE